MLIAGFIRAAIFVGNRRMSMDRNPVEEKWDL